VAAVTNEKSRAALDAAWQEFKRAVWADRWPLGVTLAFMYLEALAIALLVRLVHL